MKILKATPVTASSTGMRDVRHLLKTAATPDRLSDFNFRSSEEVAFFLRGLDEHKIEVTAAISRAKLNAAYAALCALQNKLDVIDSMSVTIAYEFRKERTKLMPLLLATKASLEKKRDRALGLMQRAARRQEPDLLTATVAEAKALLTAKLGMNYSASKDYVYVTAKGDYALCFNHYMQFDGLQNAHQDYTYPEYYVVLSAVVEGQNVQLYANTLHKFRAPGAFNLGEPLVSTNLNAALHTLLAADEFIDNDQRMNLEQMSFEPKRFKTPVVSLSVLDGKVVAELRGNREQCVLKTRLLHKELTGAFSASLGGYVLKHKLVPKGKNRYQASYVAVPGMAANGLDATAQAVLKNQLGLKPEQIAAVRRLLMKGY